MFTQRAYLLLTLGIISSTFALPVSNPENVRNRRSVAEESNVAAIEPDLDAESQAIDKRAVLSGSGMTYEVYPLRKKQVHAGGYGMGQPGYGQGGPPQNYGGPAPGYYGQNPGYGGPQGPPGYGPPPQGYPPQGYPPQGYPPQGGYGYPPQQGYGPPGPATPPPEYKPPVKGPKPPPPGATFSIGKKKHKTTPAPGSTTPAPA